MESTRKVENITKNKLSPEQFCFYSSSSVANEKTKKKRKKKEKNDKCSGVRRSKFNIRKERQRKSKKER